MRRLRGLCAVAACLSMVVPALRASGARGVAIRAPACAPALRATLRLAGRVDSLLPAPSRAVVALVAASSSDTRFLSHDDLLILAPDGRIRARIVLPAYEIPPGLAAATDARGVVYAIVDTTLLVIDTETGRVVARRPLDVQALGWPAAIAVAPGGRIYVAGQPPAGRAAALEALTVSPQGEPHVVWRAPLGLTHAGIWLGLAGKGLVAAYLPNADDVHGTVALFDERAGALRASYAVPVSPAAADPAHDRLYLDDAGTIRALSLREGRPAVSAPGTGPLALAPARGLAAFAHDGAITVASAHTLLPLGHVPIHDALSLAFTPDGAALLVGRRGGVTRVDTRGCGVA